MLNGIQFNQLLGATRQMSFIVEILKWCLDLILKLISYFRTRKASVQQLKRDKVRTQYEGQELFDTIRINMAHHFTALGLLDEIENLTPTHLLAWANDLHVMTRIRDQAPGLYYEMITFRELNK